MGDESVRWTVMVDKATDRDLRMYLASHGLKRGELSKFIEEAVRWRLLELAAGEARVGFADLSDQEIIDLVDDAVAEARGG
jgi:hypothetical protein